MAEKGHISKIELPDGSLAWLNSGSVISYNNRFASDNRDIQLSGEAYFEAAENSQIPMVVNCGELKVKVVGTRFNVSSYPEAEEIEVTLEKGAVDLSFSQKESFHKKLKKGEQARFDCKNQKLTVQNVNTARYTSWKEGIINIYDQPLEEVAKRLGTRYNQHFIVNPQIKDFRYTFTIKNESLDEIIRLMEKITPVKAIQKNITIEFQPDKSRMRNTGG